MKRRCLLSTYVAMRLLWAQEANSGFDLRGRLSGETSYSHQLANGGGGPLTGGFRLVLYPTLKLSSHWTASAAIQTYVTPYFYEEFSRPEHRLATDILQANLTYSQFWERGWVAVRVGQLPTSFGSFLLRYDDAINPLIDVPLTYGYDRPVTDLSLPGGQVDLTQGSLDARAQFTTLSPASRWSILDRDQYGNWAGGVGVTIRQGFRVGVSAYRGPYLNRHDDFFFPGEAKPKNLPATAVGIDTQYGRGPWNVYGEWQHFQLDHRLIPEVREQAGYGELRRVLSPRWYAAARLGYLRSNVLHARNVCEVVIGFRPNRYQVAKLGYEVQRGSDLHGNLVDVLSFQLVTTFRVFSIAGK